MKRGTLIQGSAIALAVVAAGALSGCAEVTVVPNVEPASVARRLGVPRCQVSAPMTQEEVLDVARRDGNSDVAKGTEWASIVATYRPGDELRKIACLVHGIGGAAGDMYFGLFRDGKLIEKLNYIIVD
jgi:hypothetical protein